MVVIGIPRIIDPSLRELLKHKSATDGASKLSAISRWKFSIRRAREQ